VALCLLVLAAPADAFQSCSQNGGVLTVTFGTQNSGELRQSGNQILADGVQCGGTATTANTDTINVVGDADIELLTLNLAGGTFLGGATDEPGTSDEIEINFDPGGGFPDADVLIYGTAGADHITLGQLVTPDRSAVNLNADEADGIDADLVMTGERSVDVSALGGNDVLSSVGGDGMPEQERFGRLFGQEGNDDFEIGWAVEATPGPGDDTLRFRGTGASGSVSGLGRVSYYFAPAGVQVTLQPDVDAAADGGTLPGADGHGGTDTYFGWPGSLDGSNTGGDTLNGANRDENFRGWGGADVINGGAGPDRLRGGAGIDTIHGGDGDDEIRGEGGDDIVAGDGGPDIVDGGAGSDAESGGDGDDVFEQSGIGQPQNDLPNGADDLSGGPGTDLVQYGDTGFGGFGPGALVGRTAAVTVDLDGAADDGGAGEGDNARADIEQVTGGLGDDTLVGNAAANVLRGFAGADVLRGGDSGDQIEGLGATDDDPLGVEADVVDGGDTLDGGGGADVINGNEGDDTIEARDTVVDTIDCGLGNDGGNADSVDALTRCEVVLLQLPPDPQPTATPAPTATPKPVATPAPTVTPPLPRASTLISFPSARRCVSRRRLRLRVKRSVVGTVRSVVVHVNGKRKARVVGRRVGLPVDLRGLPRGTFRVRLKITLADGRVVSDTRKYRTCRPKRRG
jgi:Ca2+-binding RTX toxin-like protein